MRAVLGIDAAWTSTQPSGVALVVEEGAGWRCLRVAPSYQQFISPGAIDWTQPPPPGSPPVSQLIEACRGLLGDTGPEIVAVDMPLATGRITGYRAADRAVSQTYGGLGCATHTPSAKRPGALSERLKQELGDEGYPLKLSGDRGHPALLEVYPHPALILLAGSSYRLPYKAGKAARYWPKSCWPDLPAPHLAIERKKRIIVEWEGIFGALDSLFEEVSVPLPPIEAPWNTFKRVEDALDALVCAWVGCTYLADNVTAYGDRSSTIWIPSNYGVAPTAD